MTTITSEVLAVDGAPQAGVTIAALPVGTHDLLVESSWDDGTSWTAVRGGRLNGITGGAFVRDYFPALEREVTYRVTVDDDAEVVEAAPLTVPSDYWWLQDPLNPRIAQRLRTSGWASMEGETLVMMGALASATFEQSTETVRVIGSAYPVVSAGQRQVAASADIKFGHEVAAEGGALKSLLMGAGQLVLRSTGSVVLDPVAYVVLPAVTETRSRDGQVALFEGEAIQARPLNLAVVVPWFTYDQVNALWGDQTYDDVDAARPGDTYLDWARDPEVGA